MVNIETVIAAATLLILTSVVPSSSAWNTVTSKIPNCTTRRHFFHTAGSSLATVTIITSAPHPTLAAKTKTNASPLQLLQDARIQLDLAVQASSVQAWSDAANLVQDPMLDASNLLKLFADADAGGTSSSVTSSAEFKTASLDSVSRMRDILFTATAAAASEGGGSNKIQTEDAMAIMKYGTTARVAIDSYLELFGKTI